jgi:hypothetical protein
MEDQILTPEVIAAHRLPIPVDRITALCQAAPEGSLLEQRGEWIVIIDPKKLEVTR